MTIEEAQAFVGEQPCIIKTLTEKDLYCEPPEVQPPPKRRQKRDTVNNLPEFSVCHIFLFLATDMKDSAQISCSKWP